MVDKQKGCWTFTVQLDGKESGVSRCFSETSGNCGETGGSVWVDDGSQEEPLGFRAAPYAVVCILPAGDEIAG